MPRVTGRKRLITKQHVQHDPSSSAAEIHALTLSLLLPAQLSRQARDRRAPLPSCSPHRTLRAVTLERKDPVLSLRKPSHCAGDEFLASGPALSRGRRPGPAGWVASSQASQLQPPLAWVMPSPLRRLVLVSWIQKSLF